MANEYRVSQFAVEVLRDVPVPDARVSQFAVEVLRTAEPPVVASGRRRQTIVT